MGRTRLSKKWIPPRHILGIQGSGWYQRADWKGDAPYPSFKLESKLSSECQGPIDFCFWDGMKLCSDLFEVESYCIQ